MIYNVAKEINEISDQLMKIQAMSFEISAPEVWSSYRIQIFRAMNAALIKERKIIKKRLKDKLRYRVKKL